MSTTGQGATGREVDAVTGVETTGHSWDGIKELNKPLPRWWVWTFYVTILWSIGYWVVYPAWPTLNGYTRGYFNYSQRATVAGEIGAARAAQGALRQQVESSPLAAIRSNPDLLRFATAGGAVAFQNNCAACHGRGAQGSVGYPNLADDDWLWGGSVDEIHKTILYGIRSEHKETRASQMPRYGLDKLLTDKQIDEVAEHILTLSGKPGNAAAAQAGAKIFADQCAACHGADGKGMKEQGSANLTDAIWLYGASKGDIVESIKTGRGGQMPAWAGKLDAATTKMLAIYVHGLGGGK